MGSSATVSANEFESGLQEVEVKPTQLNTDGGGACSSSFSKLLERQSTNHNIRQTPDRRIDLAMLETAMGTRKHRLGKQETAQRETTSPHMLEQ